MFNSTLESLCLVTLTPKDRGSSTAAETHCAFRGRLMSLLRLRLAGSHLGLCSHRSLRVFPTLGIVVSFWII